MSYIIAPKALMDIAEISNYISDDNPAAAIALEDRFFQAFDTLASMPGMGHKRTDILPATFRVWTVGVYLIVYVDNTNPLEIARILHGKRDIRSLEWPHP